MNAKQNNAKQAATATVERQLHDGAGLKVTLIKHM
jgi:hypothetical protein